MKVIEILKGWLGAHGFSGLVREDFECGCEAEDLIPCEGDPSNCKPGYKVACTPDCDHDPGYEEGNWHIQTDMPKEVEKREPT